MPQINYRDILKASWSVAWRKKYLWLLGFFSALELTVLFSPLADYIPEKAADRMKMARTALDYAIEKPVIVGGMVCVLLATMIILWVIRIWGQAALIKVADLEDQGIGSNFTAGAEGGKAYFKKVFWISLLINIFLVGLAIALLVPAAFVLVYAGEAYGLAVIMAAVLIFVPLAITASFIKTYALIYSVIVGLDISSSMERAYQIFRNNLKSSFIMLLWLTMASLLIGAVLNFVEYFLNPAYLIFSKLLYGSYGKIGLNVSITVKYLSNTAILFLFLSIFEAFYQISWIRFFRQIAGRKITETKKEKELKSKEIPEPEGANLDLLEK